MNVQIMGLLGSFSIRETKWEVMTKMEIIGWLLHFIFMISLHMYGCSGYILQPREGSCMLGDLTCRNEKYVNKPETMARLN